MKKYLICTFLAVIITVVHPLPIEAESVSLGIYPPIIRLKMMPNQTQQTTVNITNYSSSKQAVLLRALPFDGALGSDEIHYQASTPQPVSNLTFKGISLLSVQGEALNTLSLDPLQTQQINLKVSAPASFDHKDYYFSLVALNDPQATQSAIETLLGVSSNILISVDPVAPQAQINRFRTQKFFSKGPVSFNLKVANTGDSVFIASGTVIIKNIFGQKVGTVLLPQHFILAHSSRSFSDSQTSSLSWNKGFLFGLYKADLSLTIEGGNSLTSHTYFLALPTTALIITLLVLLFIIGIYLRVRKKLA
jgi:hypothetical protein